MNPRGYSTASSFQFADIRLAQYDANGNLDGFFTVADDSFSGLPTYWAPQVAVSSATSALVVWDSENSGGSDSVQMRLYNPATGALGTDVQLFNNPGSGNNGTITGLAIDVLSNGSYIVAASAGAGGGDDNEIWFEFVSATGVQSGFNEISSTQNNNLRAGSPSLAALDGGGFVIAWSALDNALVQTDVVFRIYNNAGALVQGDTAVTGSGSNFNAIPEVVALNDGGFLVFTFDSITNEIWVQNYSASGSTRGSNTLVADNLDGGFSYDATVLADGRVQVSYETNTQNEIIILDTRDVATNGGYTPDDFDIGTIYDDTFTANSGDAYGHFGNDDITDGGGFENIYAGAGADTVRILGVSSNESVFGGSGNDFLTVSNTPTGVTIDLDAGTVTQGAITQVAADFEHAVGTDFDDILIGTDGPNSMFGGDGNDTLNGGIGNDILTGGNGDDVFFLFVGQGLDTVFGGGGIDTVVISNWTSDATVVLGNAGSLTFGLSAPMIGVENFNSGTGNDHITGDGGINVIRGRAGTDTIFGGGGSDTIYGGDDADSIYGGGGTDTVYGENGDDTFFLASGGGLDFTYGGAGIDTMDVTGAGGGATAVLGNNGSLAFGATTRLMDDVENFRGSDFSDTVTGDSGANEIRGEDGNDTINGGTGDDTIFGGSGDDTLDGGLGNDSIYGNNGNDYITVSNLVVAQMIVNGGADTDTLELITFDASGWTYSAAGVATFFTTNVVTSGIEILIGSEFNDILNEAASTQTIFGGFGNDIIIDNGGASSFDSFDGGAGIDTLDLSAATAARVLDLEAGTLAGYGGASNFENAIMGAGGDTVSGTADANTISGGGGADVVFAGGGDDVVTGGTGSDSLTGGSGADNLTGNGGNDHLIGNTGNDVMYGGNNNDTLDGQGDADDLFGGFGADILNGGAGFDELFGGGGTDTLNGGSGNDTVDGGSGADIINGVAGSDSIFGGDGNDSILGGNGFDTIEAGGDDDIVDAGLGNDTIYGGKGNDTILGNAGSDDIYGGDDADRLEGQGGNDELFGGAGTDELFGGVNNDTLDGGAGDDTMTGGTGADDFVFVDGFGVDTVTDFLVNVDDLDFSGFSAINSFGDWLAASDQVGADVICDFGSAVIILQNVTLGSFDAADFIF